MARTPSLTGWVGVVLDAPDARALAYFYRDLFGWPLADDEANWCTMGIPGAPANLAFQTEPLFRAPTWPAAPAQQQMMLHLDVGVSDLAESVAHALSLGATLPEHQPQPDVRVLLDPVGHPFCLYLDLDDETPSEPGRVAAHDFSRSWQALHRAVGDLTDDDFARPSGCAGWLVRDLVSHLVIGAQDVLVTLATPTDAAPTRDAVTYWEVATAPPGGDDPLDALTVRLAAAYGDPGLLTRHLDDVGSAAARAAERADPQQRVATRGEVLTVADYLAAYVVEWTLHHLDLVAHRPAAVQPTSEGLARSRTALEQIAGAAWPMSFTDTDALLVGTGRRSPTDTERAALGPLAARVPLVLG